MEFSKYAALTISDSLKEFSSDIKLGLSSEAIEFQTQKFGPNVIKGKKLSWIHILLRQFQSPLVYLLIFAAILALLLKEKIDGIMILLFVLIDAIFGFYQEYKSERAVELLKRLVLSKYKVVRNGEKVEVNSDKLVPGDIILLSSGDIIPVDVRFVDVHDLFVDESVLTGESIEIVKVTDDIFGVTQIYEAKNIGFSGTRVVSGRGTGVVFSTGSRTEIGRISKLSQDTFKKSSFEKETLDLSMFILKIVAVTLMLVFGVNLLVKGLDNFSELLIFSVALAVSVIPEALPVVTTFSLSSGALKLAKNKVVVKRLSAVEDLGGIEILCTDKTGTLTENSLSVSDVSSKDEDLLLFYSALASTQNIKKKEANNAFDIAIYDRISEKQKELVEQVTILDEIPFDPVRRKNSVLIKQADKSILILRGAPEEILSECTNVDNKETQLKWLEERALEGKRSVAIAYKYLEKEAYEVEDEVYDLIFVGFISFMDPIKETTPVAINHAKKLGITVKILTGDSKEVAGFVGKQIGLIEDVSNVLSGKDLENLSDEEFEEKCSGYNVFARLSPDQKYKVIQKLMEKHTVGFLGEGINDGPALKAANVGLVVHSASDVARESADVILLNKSLDVIINGVKEGRKVFSNTSKYIKATLASNFGNFYAVALSTLFVNYLPMLPIQLLLLNLVSDFPMISMSTDSVDDEVLMKPSAFNLREFASIATVLGIVSTVFDLLFFGIFSRQGEQVLHTAWFIGSSLTELLFIYSIRSNKLFFKAKRPSNLLMILTVPAIIFSICVSFLPIGENLFKFVALSQQNLIMVLGLVIAYFVSTEISKVVYYKHKLRKL